MRNQVQSFFVIALTALVLSTMGCGDLIPPRPPLNPPEQAVLPSQTDLASGGDAVGANEELPGEPFEGDWNEWYVHRFGSQVVGSTEFAVSTPIDHKQPLAEPSEVQYRKDEQMIFRSGRTSFLRRVVVTSVESLDGNIKQFQSVIDTGPVSSTIRGVVGNNRLSIKTSGNLAGTDRQIECPTSTRGLFAVEQSLRRRRIEKDETRRMSIVLPSLESVGVVELQCRGDASVAMIDGNYQLLREVDVMMFRDAKLVDSSIVWVNETGVIEKMLRPELRLESFRSDRMTARTLFSKADPSAVTVRVTGALPMADNPSQVAYLIVQGAEESEREGADRPTEFSMPAVANQSTRRVEAGQQVLVSTETKAGDGFEKDTSEPIPADTAATGLIDLGQPAVTRMAQTIGELPIMELASELAHLTQNSLSLSTQGELRSASTIIRSRNAGVFDHAVVLAALLRARQIPARLTLGLVRNDEPGRSEASGNQASGNEASGSEERVLMKLVAGVVVWIDGQWVTIDPMSAKFNRVDQLCLSRPGDDDELRAQISALMRRLMNIDIQVRGVK